MTVLHFFRDITLDGVTGMAGNLREWAADESTAGSRTAGYMMSGSWNLDKGKYFAADYSSRKPTASTSPDLGFRVVISE